jgi:hypothetical protein
MSEDDITNELILNKIWKQINVRLSLWGDTFGRPYDNYYSTKEYSFKKDERLFIISFNENMKLLIYEPKNIQVSMNIFQILDAKKVRLEWHLYGPKYNENDTLYYEYIKHDNQVVMYKGGFHQTEMISKTFYINSEPALRFY